MTGEIISVGTELLLGQIVDTHAATMAKVFAQCGITCRRRTTVGDNLGRIVSAIRESLQRADVVVTIGGLGPTMDDLTRDAIALALDDTLETLPEMQQQLREFFERRGLRWTESILRQAEKPTCAELISNPNGTAPGLIARKNGKTVVALPGPKGEFEPMANGPVREFLATLSGEVFHSVVVRVVGMGESHVEELVKPLMASENPTLAPYAHLAEVSLRLTARAANQAEAESLIAPMLEDLRRILGKNIFALDDTPLEVALTSLMKERGVTVAVSESMTGGELAARLSHAPGSSQVFLGGATCYTAEAKVRISSVPEDLIATQGAVSEACARSMAQGIREALGSDFALSVSGNAGPSSDVGDQPVGLVFIGLASSQGVEVMEHRWRGTRADIRRRATQSALIWLRDTVMAMDTSDAKG